MSAPGGYGKPSGYSGYAIPNMTPEQMNMFRQYLNKLGSSPGIGQGIDYMSRLASGDEDIFAQIEAPAYSALQQNLAGIANRFSGAGAQQSSAFQNMLSGASSQMAENLAAQRQSLQQNAIDKLLGYHQSALNVQPYTTGLQQKDKFDWNSILGQIPALLLKAYLGA